jgi:hypothetical protein
LFRVIGWEKEFLAEREGWAKAELYKDWKN